MAAGVEVARLRRDNKVLLDDIADLRGLYDVCVRDRTGTSDRSHKRQRHTCTQ